MVIVSVTVGIAGVIAERCMLDAISCKLYLVYDGANKEAERKLERLHTGPQTTPNVTDGLYFSTFLPLISSFTDS